MTSQVLSSPGFLLRVTLELCKDRNFIIAAYFFSPIFVLASMLSLLSTQENENLALTSPFLNITHSGIVSDTLKHRPVRLAGKTEEWVSHFGP